MDYGDNLKTLFILLLKFIKLDNNKICMYRYDNLYLEVAVLLKISNKSYIQTH